MTTAPAGYSAPAKLIHWVTALAIIATIPIALTMVRIDQGPLQNQLYDLHRSFGVLILLLTALRLLWRLFRPAPPLVEGLPAWQMVAARSSHFLLYVLLFAIPLIGWMATSAYGAPITVFGLFEWPAVMDKDQHLAESLFRLHRWLGYALVALLAVHVAAALHHHIIRKDETLRRMLPGYQSGPY